MARGLSEFLPDDLFQQNRKQDVIRFLQQQPAPANVKRNWLFLWGLWVGIRINLKEYTKVQEGSIDA